MATMIAAVALRLLLTPAVAAPTLECSYNGEVASAGGPCTCRAPWTGPHCGQLPSPPPTTTGAETHDDESAAVFYRRILVQSDATVAACDHLVVADCTDDLNAALNHSGRVVVPPLHDAAGAIVPWRVRGFNFRASNARVVFAAGVEVQALKNATYLYACEKVADLAEAHNKRNLSVTGYGASWRMWREDYVQHCKHSEFRMGWSIDNCTDVEVAGLTIRETGGDGLIVMSNVWLCDAYSKRGVCNKGHYSKQGATRNLLIRDVILDRNFRQGMSVISAENMLVINTTFSNTDGTPPMAVSHFRSCMPPRAFTTTMTTLCCMYACLPQGVDLEPDLTEVFTDPLRLTNISFRNCAAVNNSGPGFSGYFAGLLGGAKGQWAKGLKPTTITFTNCTVRGGNYTGWSWGALYPELAGSILVSGGSTEGTRCFILQANPSKYLVYTYFF